MEAVTTNSGGKQKSSLPLGHARISGRIFNRRRMNGKDGSFWLTVLKLPAQDSYSHPATVEVVSQSNLGEVGDDWEGEVVISGFPHSYNSKPDAETGEIKRIISAQNRLHAVDG
jgi:hypothetical protein